jgi:hypothetical protein
MYHHTRSTLTVLVVLTLSTVFLTCEGDNNTEPEVNESLVGSWALTSVVMRDTPIGTMTMAAGAFLGMSGTGAATSTLVFVADGTVTLITTYTDESEDTEPGTWSQEGDSLVVDGAGIDQTVSYELDDTSLTLTRIFQIDFDGDGTSEDTPTDMIYTLL